MYARAMYNVCLHYVKQPAIAEDLMQEAFISAFRNLASFKGEACFGAWLKKITVNRCIDYLRVKKINFEPLEHINELPSEIEPDDEVFEKRTIEDIINAIAKLPEGYRTILNLHLFEEYNHNEIATLLNISPSTSRSQYSRAKALLAKKLES